jgi:hypothetical protein
MFHNYYLLFFDNLLTLFNIKSTSYTDIGLLLGFNN